MPDETPEVNPDRLYEQGIDTSIKMNTEAAASPDAEEARQEEVRPEPASEPAPAPEPEKGPSEVDRQQDRVRELEDRLARVERDYGASSTEAKRLAERVKQADQKLSELKSKYALEELEGWTPTPQAEEDRPVTVRELHILEEQRKWKTAEEMFFSSEKNADLSTPSVKRWVKSLLFTEDGLLAYPNKTPKEAFEAAAREARKVFNAERLRGRQEREMTREDIKKAAVAEGTGKPPEKKPEPQEEKPDENEYASMWRKFKEKRG